MIIKIKNIKGVTLPHRKGTSEIPTETLPIPKLVEIPMQQHIGAPCKVLVGKGDYVYVGQVLGDTEKFVSAPIHSSISGTVVQIKDMILHSGVKCESIVIETDGKQEVLRV